MSSERFIERRAEAHSASARLQEALAEPETAILRDAVIQRFEFTFELVWKALQLYLEHRGLECGSPRATLKNSFAEGLIATPDEADAWLQMLDDRNRTSHAYDEALARSIYQHIVRDYAPRLARMAAQLQALSWD
ncbi:MAG: nucleotidyltransferase substrate binding protein [Kiritimatiellaeota bacterium]|nr:nucleotidyltransferase substrate binding protein [Kiritimatiellota bacterium]